jgi:predicted nuclease with RNAse H fold
LGDIGNRLGEFVEHMVMPTVVRLFQAQGLEVHEVHPDISVKRDGRGIQIDLLVVNDGVAIAVECKSKMTIDYVDEHVQRMDKLKQMLPAYRHHRVLGAVAALVMPDEVAEYAEEQGFYVLVQSGETLTIGNQPAFCARAW